MSPRPLRVCILHPDLGIGGAERLIVDAALGHQKHGHTVHIYTSYHDPTHAFEETTNGVLSVRYKRSPFPRHIFNALHILLAILRQLHLVITLLFLITFGKEKPYDVYLVDQLSACVPLLRWGTGRRVVFYCHFPDKLLADGQVAAVEGVQAAPKGRGGIKELVKRVYRMPMNWVEEVTTRKADVILANSKFTSRVFKYSFPSIKIDPVVVYPGINITAYHTSVNLAEPDIAMVSSARPTFLSLNRFERKKNTLLAINAFGALPNLKSTGIRLVIAGGYDPRVADNVECLSALLSRCTALNLTYDIVSPRALPPIPSASPHKTDLHVLFVLNFSHAQRTYLLSSPATLALLYTPQNEHFGIGPVEAMVCGVPVVACDSGGPVESVLDPGAKSGQRTGYLVPSDAAKWTEALEKVVKLGKGEREKMGKIARARVEEMFSLESLTKGIEGALQSAVALGPVETGQARLNLVVVCVGVGFGLYLSKYV
ncbi:Alpha-1,3-mannosyltransferase-like protein [Ceratobasidium sp. 392]|nr:Alpha-1,3-mannosyltransferase-like protein [Ceratobasidium sp. 392]